MISLGSLFCILYWLFGAHLSTQRVRLVFTFRTKGGNAARGPLGLEERVHMRHYKASKLVGVSKAVTVAASLCILLG